MLFGVLKWLLRQGWNGMFEPEVALCGGRRVVRARPCAQYFIYLLPIFKYYFHSKPWIFDAFCQKMMQVDDRVL